MGNKYCINIGQLQLLAYTVNRKAMFSFFLLTGNPIKRKKPTFTGSNVL
jgi:hypothetical protein